MPKSRLHLILAINAFIDALIAVWLWDHFAGPAPIWAWWAVIAAGVGGLAFFLSRASDSRPPAAPRSGPDPRS